jgi:hypothetical protein
MILSDQFLYCYVANITSYTSLVAANNSQQTVECQCF